MTNKMKTKSIIILFGKSNVGKTSVLQQLIIRLCGGNSINSAIQSTFLSMIKCVNVQNKPYYKDVNMILRYKNANIFISTGGDDWAKIRGNFDFVKSIKQPKSVYVYHQGRFEAYDKLNKEEKDIYKEYNIFISAASLSKKGATEAAKYFTVELAEKLQSEAWIRKDKGSLSNYIDPLNLIRQSDDQYAKEIITVIDRILAGKII